MGVDSPPHGANVDRAASKTSIGHATMHKSVYERFDLPQAFEYDTWKLIPDLTHSHSHRLCKIL